LKFERYDDESPVEHLLRLVGIKLEEKPSNLEWQDIVAYCGLDCHYDSLRKAMQPEEYGAYAIYKYMLERDIVDDEYLDKLEAKQLEVKIEIQKLRDLRSGYAEKEVRGVARKEAILEEIRMYLDTIEPFEVPEYKELQQKQAKMIGGVADAHFGKDIVINGLDDNPINTYNEEVFYKRMWNLFNEYVSVIEEEGISKIYFFELSDSIEGILRISGLQHIKYGIVESSIKYASFLSRWLDKLSEHVEIEYYACLGNHNEIRPIGSKSGDFAKENMQYVIDEILSANLKNNDRVKINPTKGLQYVDIDGYKVLATHGQDEKNLISSVKDYKDIYDVKIDLMISGHLHNSRQETASLHTKVVQFPSILGIDFFSMKLKKTAKAECKIILIKGNRFINMDIEI